jgi:hypothetical protein
MRSIIRRGIERTLGNPLNGLKADPKSKLSSTRQEGVYRHDATRELSVADRLASATERKVQDLTADRLASATQSKVQG